MSVFAHYPEVWNEAMFDEAVAHVASFEGDSKDIFYHELVEFMMDYLPECYEVLTRGLDPSDRAYDLLAERFRARE